MTTIHRIPTCALLTPFTLENSEDPTHMLPLHTIPTISLSFGFRCATDSRYVHRAYAFIISSAVSRMLSSLDVEYNLCYMIYGSRHPITTSTNILQRVSCISSNIWYSVLKRTDPSPPCLVTLHLYPNFRCSHNSTPNTTLCIHPSLFTRCFPP